GRIPGGFPKAESIKHVDLSLGGPIQPNKVWFFSSYRYASDENGISRAASDLKNLQTFRPDFQPFNNPWKTTDPYVKVTSQLSERHELSAFYHYDRMQYTSHQNNDADPIVFQSGGGSVSWLVTLTYGSVVLHGLLNGLKSGLNVWRFFKSLAARLMPFSSLA